MRRVKARYAERRGYTKKAYGADHWKVDRHGLTVELVLADGRRVPASATVHARPGDALAQRHIRRLRAAAIRAIGFNRTPLIEAESQDLVLRQ